MASLCSLRGRAMAMKESTMPAVEWFTTALEIDPRCMVALQGLIDWHLLPPNKQMSLLMRLELECLWNSPMDCYLIAVLFVNLRLKFEPGEEWLREIYMSRLDPFTDGLLENFDHVSLSQQLSVLLIRTMSVYLLSNT